MSTGSPKHPRGAAEARNKRKEKPVTVVLPLLSEAKQCDYSNGTNPLGYLVQTQLDELQHRCGELVKKYPSGSMSPTRSDQKHGESSVWHSARQEIRSMQERIKGLQECKQYVAVTDSSDTVMKEEIQGHVDTNDGCLTMLACDTCEFNQQWVVNTALRCWSDDKKAKAVGHDSWTDVLIPTFIDTYMCLANECR